VDFNLKQLKCSEVKVKNGLIYWIKNHAGYDDVILEDDENNNEDNVDDDSDDDDDEDEMLIAMIMLIAMAIQIMVILRL
jgi:hypothetical protein